MRVAVAAGMILHLAACAGDAAEPTSSQGVAGQEATAAGGLALPGARPMPAELRERLRQAYEATGPDYEPRSEHLADRKSVV